MCANLIEVTLTTSIYIAGHETMCTYNLLSQIDTLQCTRISLASGKSHFYVPIYSLCVGIRYERVAPTEELLWAQCGFRVGKKAQTAEAAAAEEYGPTE